ncbi:baseplate protein [Vibrio phage PVP-XSN]|uniref:Baseplate protein n=1 Tax=Vibrio phage PVP-XSN TaxID=3056214 RepID=A0AAX3Y420_9CAUD|nr:baseplate protein [Vibrio phage PVP-XSN]
MANQLPTLPDVSFVETDPQAIIDDIISGYEEVSGYTLADGDPRRLFLLSIAYIIINQRQQIDASGKSNLLYYAQDDFLDHLGLMRDTPRVEAESSVTTQRFTLSSVRPNNVGIPQGTRVTADNQLYWQTTEPATIVTGQLSVDVTVEALTPGEEANGIAIGEINRLVDPIPYVQSVSNIEITAGGADREDNDSYRYRIYQAPNGFSIAGPEDAYKYWASSANSSIVDVSATSPSAGVVEIRPLLENGEIPTQAILDQVENALSPKTIRPLTDQVQVLAPNVVNYNIDFTYFIRTEDSASVSIIQEKVNSAVDDYVLWQKSRLGRDVNPDELIYRLKQAGAKRAAITTPTLQAVLETDVSVALNVTVNYGGLEDE